MARFTEIANRQFVYYTKASVFSLFASIEGKPAQATTIHNMKQRATCQLQILRRDTQTVVIATEQHTNEGASVTNGSEELASQVVKDFSLDPHLTRFIEHYGASSYEQPSPTDEQYYDEVSFTWQEDKARRPQWRRLPAEEVNELRDVT